MPRACVTLGLGACAAWPGTPAAAHGFAGEHMFVSTMIIDDPNVADEASLPTFSWRQMPAGSGPAPRQYGLNFEIDKPITETVGFGLNYGYQWLRTPGAKTVNGWQNLAAALKYKAYVNPEHEFMLSVGVVRQFARTGANGTNGAALGNDDSGSTTPTIYFGKGFGDVPIGWLRPFAITGETGFQVADKKLKVLVIPGELTQPGQHAISYWRRGQRHHDQLCCQRRGVDSRQ